MPGKGRAGLQAEQVNDRRRQIPQTHRLLDHLFGRGTPGGNDQEWDVQLGPIETRTVAEHARVFTETLAVVRGDDQPGSIEDTSTLEFVEQLPELFIEVGDAIVVSGGDERDLLRRETTPVQIPPILDQPALAAGRHDSETVNPPR